MIETTVATDLLGKTVSAYNYAHARSDNIHKTTGVVRAVYQHEGDLFLLLAVTVSVDWVPLYEAQQRHLKLHEAGRFKEADQMRKEMQKEPERIDTIGLQVINVREAFVAIEDP